ncbi:hypothetical protein R3P38DRAFT_2805869 [Favolaschia claudopus]|uniref:Uncharacterized protein n=1 Tax=Favolaschia claudopus TaxID=2862362 RepID=A0AAV9ZLP4_9AGAR
MPPGDLSNEYDDDEFLQRIANLNLNVVEDAALVPPSPRTPRPQTPSVDAPPTYSLHSPALASPRRSTVYRYDSPMRSGYTTAWAEAGVATQGVDDAIVEAVQRRPKKPRRKKAADYTHSLITRVNDNIFRGYSSVAEAEAAFAYAQARGWTRVIPGPQPAISQLPVPITANAGAEADAANPLHGSDPFDDTWFVVYRGGGAGCISVSKQGRLECQLNTLGIPNALHKSYPTKGEALSMYAAAVGRGEVSVLTPVYIP